MCMPAADAIHVHMHCMARIIPTVPAEPSGDATIRLCKVELQLCGGRGQQAYRHRCWDPVCLHWGTIWRVWRPLLPWVHKAQMGGPRCGLPRRHCIKRGRRPLSSALCICQLHCFSLLLNCIRRLRQSLPQCAGFRRSFQDSLPKVSSFLCQLTGLVISHLHQPFVGKDLLGCACPPVTDVSLTPNLMAVLLQECMIIYPAAISP